MSQTEHDFRWNALRTALGLTDDRIMAVVPDSANEEDAAFVFVEVEILQLISSFYLRKSAWFDWLLTIDERLMPWHQKELFWAIYDAAFVKKALGEQFELMGENGIEVVDLRVFDLARVVNANKRGAASKAGIVP
jgi:hypothetical protein